MQNEIYALYYGGKKTRTYENKETLLRLTAAALLVYMLVSFAVMRGRLAAAAAEEEELSRACAVLRAENDSLRQSLDSLNDEEALEAMARERLGLVRPGEIIFYFD